MHPPIRHLVCAALLIGALITPTSSAFAAGANEAVFVQTNDVSANHVLAYRRGTDGRLTFAAAYDTGGLGGRLEGSVSDPLSSQGSLVYDAAHSLLIGVNAGSNSVFAFHVDGDRLSNRVVVDSGGSFPASVAVNGDLMYVLNAGGQGRVRGFHIGSTLQPLGGSSRALNLTPATGPTTFTHTPGQIGFTPDGSQVIVTTKANASQIDVFGVDSQGRLSQTPVVNASTTPAPFGFTFDSAGHLLVGEPGTGNVSSYALSPTGALTPIATASNDQKGLCWIVRATSSKVYVSNTGSGTLSAFSIGSGGQVSVLMKVAANPGGGPIDLASTADGSFVYVELGVTGMLGEYAINSDGSMTELGLVPVQAGMEGIVVV